MIQKFTTFLLSALVGIHAYSQADIQTQDKPGWIDPIEIPATSQVSKYDVKSGVYHKLIDYQTNLGQSQYYSHFVYNVLSSGGATNVSQIEISYDSSYQEVILHELVIHRKGARIDRTEEVSFEYIKNEQQLQSNIYMGNVTALAVLEDVRKGDWVEYSYTVKGDNPVYQGSKYFISVLDDINPVDRLFVKVLYPTAEQFQYRVTDNAIAVNTSEEEGNAVLRIDRQDLEAIDLEETTPTWIIPYDFFEISNRSTWKEVNTWAMKVFDQKESDQIDQVFSEIFYPEYTQEEKINAIIDFVQDEIRYMGIETGMGSIMPFSPNQVLKQRFGDCKDKSLLMSEMMKRIGVACYPALVNSMLMENVDKHLPSGYMFDHVIVMFTYQGKEYWLDPTFSYQGGDFRSITTFDYGKALVVKEGTEDLTDMGVTDVATATHIEEHINVSSYTEPGKLTINTKLNGSRADYTRQILEYYSVKELADYYKSFYAQVFPTLYEANRLKVADDLESNEISTVEAYEIPDIWKEDQEGYEGKYTLNYQPVNVYGYLSNLSCEKKEFPVQFAYPVRFTQKTIIDFVEAIEVENEEKTYDNVAFTFTKRSELVTPTQVKLEYEYETKTKEISPEDFGKVCQDINEIVDNVPIIFYFPKREIDLEKLPFDFEFFEVNLKSAPIINEGYYIESVESKVMAFNNIIGILQMEDKDVTAAVMKEGIAAQLDAYLEANQVKESAYKPLKLTVRQLRVSEDIKKKKQTATLEFDYRVSYMHEGTTYEFKLVDTLETEGDSARALHEQNIRQSFVQLFSALSPDKFKVVE